MQSEYVFSKRSYNNLKGVHPDLTACVVVCLYRYTTVDFAVIEGVRTFKTQKELMAKSDELEAAGQPRLTWTLDSKHMIQGDGFGHAVDLVPWVNGRIPWDEWEYFRDIATGMKMAARYLRIQIVWGGDWKSKDGPHFQLDR